MVNEIHIGACVVFVDEKKEPHWALVTFVHRENSLNLSYVSTDRGEIDKHGRQIKRAKSVLHKSSSKVTGCWITEGELLDLELTE